MPRFHTLLTILLIAFAPSAHAQTTTFEFLRLDRSARIAALGGNSASLAHDINSFFKILPCWIQRHTNKPPLAFKNICSISIQDFLPMDAKLKTLEIFGAGITFVSYGSFDEN